MKTKIIPFDLKTAKKIQAGEIEGRIITECGYEVRIICFDRENITGFPIVALAREAKNYEVVYFYDKYGAYAFKNEVKKDLVLEVPDNEPQFKPFDKVLVRNSKIEIWQPRLYEMYSGGTEKHYCQDGQGYLQCIHYEGNEHLVGTTDKPKED